MRSHHLFALVVLALVVPSGHADGPEALLRDATLFGRFNTLSARVDMEIHYRGTRRRTLAVYIDQTDPRNQKALVHVTAPAFLNRLKFLSLGSPGSVDRWMSSSSGVRRITEASRDEPVFDSDFTVEDFSPGHDSEYTIRHAGTATVGGELCDVIEISPVGTSVGYAMRRVYVSRDDRLLVQAEYYSEGGDLVRSMELRGRFSVNGQAFPGTIVMSTLNTRSHTVLTVQSVQIDVPIPARIFSRGGL